MTTDETTQNQYVYLDEQVDLPGEDELLVAAPEFHTVWMGQLNSVEVNSVTADRNKYSSQGFPEQNLDHFYMIPLYVNPLYRAAYLAEYSGAAVPPDCMSHNGVTPVNPLEYNGQIIQYCQACPLYGFGKPFKCHTKPSILALAYFPQYGDLLVPIRKELPGLSAKAGNALSQQLSSPVILNSVPKRLPLWTRVVRVSVFQAPNQRFGGKTPTWKFDVLNTESSYPDMPHNFVPPHLINEVQKLVGVAKAWKAQTGATAIALPTTPVAGHLAGGTAPPAGSVAPPAALPAGTTTVVAEEEASDY